MGPNVIAMEDITVQFEDAGPLRNQRGSQIVKLKTAGSDINRLIR